MSVANTAAIFVDVGIIGVIFNAIPEAALSVGNEGRLDGANNVIVRSGQVIALARLAKRCSRGKSWHRHFLTSIGTT